MTVDKFGRTPKTGQNVTNVAGLFTMGLNLAYTHRGKYILE